MSVELATSADIPAIMAIERTEGFEDLVGRWPEAEHRAEMARPSARYLVMREAGEIAGFVLFQGLGDPHAKAHLRRIAVRHPGRGDGARLLAAAVGWLYADTDVNRLDLDVYVDNDRARRAYESAGFQVEGRLRDFHRYDDGSFRDMWLMSILRRDWLARSA